MKWVFYGIMRCALFILLSALGATRAHARTLLPMPASAIVDIGVQAGRAHIGGVRYQNPGRPPVILWHGLVETSWDWQEFARQLWERGFDVWIPNLPGHGKGTHRTVFKNTRLGDYGFDPMATFIVPEFTKYVREETGMKVGEVGHSMGGMLAKLQAEGVRRDPGGMTHKSQAVARERAKDMAFATVAIGSPPDFRSQNPLFKFFSFFVKDISRWAGVSVPMTGRDVAPTASRSQVVEALRQGAWAPVDQVGMLMAPRGILRTSNLTREEYAGARERGFSNFHTDLAHVFSRWQARGQYDSEDGFDYEPVAPVHGPLLLIAGDEDELALSELIRQEAQRRRAQGSDVYYAEARQTSHVDLILGEKRGREVADYVADFLYASLGQRAPVARDGVIGPERPRSTFRERGLAMRCFGNAYKLLLGR